VDRVSVVVVVGSHGQRVVPRLVNLLLSSISQTLEAHRHLILPLGGNTKKKPIGPPSLQGSLLIAAGGAQGCRSLAHLQKPFGWVSRPPVSCDSIGRGTGSPGATLLNPFSALRRALSTAGMEPTLTLTATNRVSHFTPING